MNNQLWYQMDLSSFPKRHPSFDQQGIHQCHPPIAAVSEVKLPDGRTAWQRIHPEAESSVAGRDFLEDGTRKNISEHL